MAKLFFIGDSITAGAWDERGGWVERLSGQLFARTATSERKHDGFYCMPYNLGISGDTVADVIRRFDREVTARIYNDTKADSVQFVFAVGVNDTVHLLEENRDHATDNTFKEDLLALIKLAKKISTNITFIGLLPVEQEKMDPCPWAPYLAYRNENIERFDIIIKDTCQSEEISFLPMLDEWKTLPDLNAHLSDGLHPNNKGHEKIAKKIGDALFTEAFTDFHTK